MRLAGSLLASILFAAACGSGGPTASNSAPPAGPTDPATALARDAVFHEQFARRTLYTWTTTEQVDELRRTGVLLSRSESPTHGTSYAEQVLDALARRGDPTAMLVYSTGYAKARHAWASPWATRAGWPDEQYGDQLVRITLRRDAIVLALSTATGAFTARDASGGPVALEDARSHPERIAALYFVSDATSSVHANVPTPSTTYREYVVINESMIEAWAVGTADIARELEGNVAAIEALAKHLRSGGAPPHMLVPSRVWGMPGARLARPEDAFTAALAFVNDNYKLDPDSLERLAALLRATPRPSELTGGGITPFAGVGTPRAKPAVRRRASTYGGTY